MKSPLILYWARRDFRITDNPALTTALQRSAVQQIPFLPFFILEDYMTQGNPEFQFGYPSRFFLAHALPHFINRFKEFLFVKGKVVGYIQKLQEQYELEIFVNDDVYPDFYSQIAKLRKLGINVTVCEDALSVPKETRTQEGNIYSVFTPFKKAVWSSFTKQKKLTTSNTSAVTYLSHKEVSVLPDQIAHTSESILALMSASRLLKVGTHFLNLHEYIEIPTLQNWYTSESEALERFKSYLKRGDLDRYGESRDSLEGDTASSILHGRSIEGKTSRMSLALAWGLISSRTLLHEIQKHYDETFDNPFSNRVSQGALIFISELIWREFYRYQFFHNPYLLDTEFQTRYRGTLSWEEGDSGLERFIAWIKGETGYPVVDAAMKQIEHTGWMHNRARMIVASILTKNLGIDWRWGQEYFRATLFDLDDASNNGGWQWAASVGTDPKPIRIFNPELQAKNYDASGAYQAKWLMRGNILQSPRVPIIEHKEARDAAILRYKQTRTE